MSDAAGMNTVTLEASSLLDHLPTDTDTDGSIDDTVDRDEHLGAVRLDVSSRVTAYHYDDEPDTVVLSPSVADTLAASHEEAHTLTADILDALEALATERDR
jgi:hypothetical protein